MNIKSTLIRCRFTRHGSKWNILDQLLPFFPKSDSLDGEIWCGKETPLGIKENTIVWHSLRYVAFDTVIPSMLFEDRFTHVLTSIDNGNYFVCNGKAHLELAVKTILDHGGEGVIVRAPRSVYQNGRSDLLHKLKAHKRDYEALAVEVQPTCLLLKLPSGLIFTVNKSEVPFATSAGDIVTFSYAYFSYSGKPVDPKIYKVRYDLEWADVLTNYYSSEQDITVTGDRAIKESDRRVSGYWTAADTGQQRMRAFFDQLALDHALDPTLPESWYPFTEEVVTAAQGGSILYHFQGSIIRALLYVYPDIGLDPSKFTRRYWYILANRKRVFDKFAEHNQFDPSIPDNWYRFTKHDVPLKKVAPYLLTFYYGKSLYDILVDVYPQSSFKEGYFKFCPGTYWKDITNRKDFFDNFANKNGFDSLVAENWYTIKNEAILSNPGGTAVLHQFGNSVAKALKFTYTQIAFDPSKFQFLSKKYWLDPNNRRRFFDSYAEKYGFNPLIPDNWYSLSSHSILSEKGGSSVLGFSGRSLVKSLQDAYPELEFNVLKFAVLPRSYWSSFTNRKKFFDSLAMKHGLDPLNESQWTSINNAQVILEKGGSSILKHYNGSLHDAVKDVYQFGIV